MQKNREKILKNKSYRGTKFLLQPKARWAEMGSHFQDFILPKKQMPSIYHMFERYYRKVILEGKGVWGSSRGLRADPRKW